jgi:hypothetical protein
MTGGKPELWKMQAHNFICANIQLLILRQICFLIDLPRLPEGVKQDVSQVTEFGKEFMYFVRAMGLDDRIIDSLRKFDFSRTNRLAFVHTM